MTTDRPEETVLLAPPRSQARPQGDWTDVELSDLQERLGATIRQRPLLSIFAAFGAGYLLTRLFSRGSR